MTTIDTCEVNKQRTNKNTQLQHHSSPTLKSLINYDQHTSSSSNKFWSFGLSAPCFWTHLPFSSFSFLLPGEVILLRREGFRLLLLLLVVVDTWFEDRLEHDRHGGMTWHNVWRQGVVWCVGCGARVSLMSGWVMKQHVVKDKRREGMVTFFLWRSFFFIPLFATPFFPFCSSFFWYINRQWKQE